MVNVMQLINDYMWVCFFAQVVLGNSGSGGVVGKGREEGEEERGKSEKKMKGKEEEGWKKGQREASVLRYKEKRQSRLFSKRIRYEVRKLNAEKRPRMKVLLLCFSLNIIT